MRFQTFSRLFSIIQHVQRPAARPLKFEKQRNRRKRLAQTHGDERLQRAALRTAAASRYHTGLQSSPFRLANNAHERMMSAHNAAARIDAHLLGLA